MIPEDKQGHKALRALLSDPEGIVDGGTLRSIVRSCCQIVRPAILLSLKEVSHQGFILDARFPSI